mmetsp:Transcript_15114/g.26170  ORF Transcript_15114/g.26170 Transcript_15114/m.26170 type:complete len:279 (+) Transcript_15114:200-1036(+)
MSMIPFIPACLNRFCIRKPTTTTTTTNCTLVTCFYKEEVAICHEKPFRTIQTINYKHLKRTILVQWTMHHRHHHHRHRFRRHHCHSQPFWDVLCIFRIIVEWPMDDCYCWFMHRNDSSSQRFINNCHIRSSMLKLYPMSKKRHPKSSRTTLSCQKHQPQAPKQQAQQRQIPWKNWPNCQNFKSLRHEPKPFKNPSWTIKTTNTIHIKSCNCPMDQHLVSQMYRMPPLPKYYRIVPTMATTNTRRFHSKTTNNSTTTTATTTTTMTIKQFQQSHLLLRQ